MAAVLFRLAFLLLLPQALGLYCWGCSSTRSWADCENKLVSRFCDDDPEWACMTKVVTTTTHGNSVTHYMKECGLRKYCDVALCNVEKLNITRRCQFECCCYDNCNTGVLQVTV